MANIFSLFGTILIDNKEANKQIDETTKKGETSGSKIGKAFGSIGKAAVAVGKATVVAAGTVGAATYKMASSTSQHADEIDKMSQKLGMSKKAYQEWDYVLSQAGVDITSMSTGLKTLTNKLDQAKNGSKSAQEMFTKLGISAEDMKKMSREEIFDAVIKGMQGMQDSTERAALANKLFGRSGQELSALFNTTAKDTEEMKKRAHELGMVMSDDAVKGGVALVDTMDTAKRSIGGFKNSVGTAAIPIIQKLADMLIKGVPKAQALFAKFTPVVTVLFDKALPPLFQLITVILPVLFSIIQQLLPPLSDVIQAILPVLITLIQQLVPPFLQIVQTIMPLIIQLINNIMPLVNQIINAVLPPLIQLIQTILPPITKIVEAI